MFTPSRILVYLNRKKNVFTTGEMENNDRRKNSKGGEQGRDEIKSSTEPSDR